MIGEADLLERVATRARRSRGGDAVEAEADIVGDGEPGQEARLLEHDADGGMRLGDGLAVEADRAGARPVEAGDEAQQRGLAAARAADERDDLALAAP